MISDMKKMVRMKMNHPLEKNKLWGMNYNLKRLSMIF